MVRTYEQEYGKVISEEDFKKLFVRLSEYIQKEYRRFEWDVSFGNKRASEGILTTKYGEHTFVVSFMRSYNHGREDIVKYEIKNLVDNHVKAFFYKDILVTSTTLEDLEKLTQDILSFVDRDIKKALN